MTKLSFAVPSRSSSKPPKPLPNFITDEQNDDESSSSSREFLTEFDSSVTLTDTKLKKLIIPPKENEWMPMKNMRNLDHPARSDVQFESQPLSEPEPVAPVSALSNGLNVRKRSITKNVDKDYDGMNDEDGDAERVPRVVESVENLLSKKLKEDLERLPEHRGAEEYDACPVEGYGAALLYGYGWEEGKGIGKNAKEDVKSVQYERRSGTGTQGLGYVALHLLRDDCKDTELCCV